MQLLQNVRQPCTVANAVRVDKNVAAAMLMHRLCCSHAHALTVLCAGPVTILNWSFPRKDITRQAQAFQLALAIREEVADLEKAGCKVIQVSLTQSEVLGFRLKGFCLCR